MLYVTDVEASLLHYHVSKGHEGEIAQVHRNPKDLDSILLGVSRISKTPVVVILDKEPLKFKWTPYGQIYIRVPKVTREMKLFIEANEHIELLRLDADLYSSTLNQFRGLFDEDGFRWFKNKFSKSPARLNSELVLLIQGAQKGSVYDLLTLMSRYGNGKEENAWLYLSHVGTAKGSILLQSMEENQIWPLFMDRGALPAIIDQKMDVSVLYYIEYVRPLVKAGFINVRLAFILFDNWLAQVGVKKVQGLYSVSLSKENSIKLSKIYEF